MAQPADPGHLAGLIRDLKRTAEGIESESADFPAVRHNIRRVLASIRMLELNVSDVADLGGAE